MHKVLLSAVLVSMLAACASTGTPEQKAGVEDKSATQKSASTSTSGVQQRAMAANPLKDPNNVLSKRSVYFDYDSSAVADEYKPMLEAHAKYLNQNAAAKVTLQGNTDERGSREYNIALGQHRADSVKKIMSVLGVSEKQMESVSLGEEKPMAEGHDESAWKQNRRADIVYQGE